MRERGVPHADEDLIGRRGRCVITFVARRGSVGCRGRRTWSMNAGAEVVVSARRVGAVVSGAASRLVVAVPRFAVG